MPGSKLGEAGGGGGGGGDSGGGGGTSTTIFWEFNSKEQWPL